MYCMKVLLTCVDIVANQNMPQLCVGISRQSWTWKWSIVRQVWYMIHNVTIMNSLAMLFVRLTVVCVFSRTG